MLPPSPRRDPCVIRGWWPGRPSPERLLRNLRLVARKTPLRFRPKTAESFDKLRTGSASPLGEGEERRGLHQITSERACWGGDLDRRTPHRFRPKTPEPASPLGEGEERRSLHQITSERACWGGDLDRRTPHRFRPKTAESFGRLRTGSASPPGEGKEQRLLEGTDTAHLPAKTAPAFPQGEARGRASRKRRSCKGLQREREREREKEPPHLRGRGSVLQRSLRGRLAESIRSRTSPLPDMTAAGRLGPRGGRRSRHQAPRSQASL